MDDTKKAEALRYQERMKEQRRLERALKKESDEECDRLAVDKVHAHDYQNLPRPEPLSIIPIKLEGDEYKNTKYPYDKYAQKKYYEEHKEKIKEKRAANKKEYDRLHSRAPGRPKMTVEEKKERQRLYYQNNKERITQTQKNWQERNKERAKELSNKYNAKRAEERQQAIANHDLSQPSPFLTAITKGGCNVCGKLYPLYNFRNPDTKYYTGCLCISCLNTYNNLNADADLMFRMRQYYIARSRANKQNEED